MNAAAIQRYAPELRTSAHTNGMKGADLILLTVALAPGGYGVRLSVVLTRSLPARHPSQRLRRPPRSRARPFPPPLRVARRLSCITAGTLPLTQEYHHVKQKGARQQQLGS